MRPTERCGGRGQAPGTAGQTRDDTAILADRDDAGKQAGFVLALFNVATELQRADVALLALAFVGGAS